jgi:hypothetical protein
MSGSGGSTFKRCGCRDPRTGRQRGQRCPHLRERGHGSWYLAVELSAAPDGRRRRVRLGGYATRAAAQAARGRLGKPGGPPRRGAAGCTTGQWLAAWLAGRPSLRPLTRRSYQHHLDTYLLPCIGSIPLAMLTAADLRVMFTAIARQRPAAGGPLSPATVGRIRATLRAALNAAIREGPISANPARLVELPGSWPRSAANPCIPVISSWRFPGCAGRGGRAPLVRHRLRRNHADGQPAAAGNQPRAGAAAAQEHRRQPRPGPRSLDRAGPVRPPRPAAAACGGATGTSSPGRRAVPTHPAT